MKARTKIDPEILLRARVHLHIVHQIPGRIRLRFGPGILDALPEIVSGGGKNILKDLKGIQDVRIDQAALSMVVTCDQAQLEPSLWQKLIDGSDQDAQEVVAFLRQVTSNAP